MTTRSHGRTADSLRPILLETGVNPYAEGSCMVHFGNTRVLCTASVEDRVPPFLRNTGKGWVTAEYAMLPRATHTRSQREVQKGQPSGRTQEIQRLIGRSLRAVIDLKLLGETQITVDCDVLQADGGTRTAAITGGYVALHLACTHLLERRLVKKHPITGQVAAVSCGIVGGTALLDLEYTEDSTAEADMNFVLTQGGGIVEIQGTAEQAPFTEEQFHAMFLLARQGITELHRLQQEALGKNA
jgi:ribonuclease PH